MKIVEEIRLGEVNFKSAGWEIRLETTLPKTPWGANHTVSIFKSKETGEYSCRWYQNGGYHKIGPLPLKQFEMALATSIVGNKIIKIYSNEINANITSTIESRNKRAAETRSKNNNDFITRIENKINNLTSISDKTFTAADYISHRNYEGLLTPTGLGQKASLVCKTLLIECPLSDVYENGYPTKLYMEDILNIVSELIINENRERNGYNI
jgi:hypothetical protein